ncbi:hypothetical protein NEMIN01_0692 [Nematocida minor]|uniref:uncharacterized protein n=1 Tax=Nematocida minor TaxID=1912983 RepID=UPI00221F4030|nr:uncharacterized protein NEMIN01_0692 [Nematocida minor]KAI5189829.1 hypothetical protein NEMIN01_0692 [Nematocida minor]
MKSQEIRKILGAGAALLSFFTGCRGSSGNFNEKDLGRLASAGVKRSTSEMSNTHTYYTLQPVSGNTREQQGGALLENPHNLYQTEEIGNGVEAEDAADEDELSLQPPIPKRKRKGIEELNSKMWGDIRLTNLKRRGSKVNSTSICDHRNLNKNLSLQVTNETYEKSLRKDIEAFFTHFASSIDKSALWYFIGSRTTNIITKHKDLFGLNMIIREKKTDRCRQILESLQGYYPRVFDDLLRYVEAHQPMRISRDDPPTEWKERIGDVYMRNYYDINYRMLENQKSIHKIDSQYSAVAYAACMVLALPEVFEDFYNINAEFIKRTRLSADAVINEQHQQVLLKIHRLAHMCAKEKINDRVYEELYSALESAYGEGSLEELAVAEVYRKMYAVLGNFYEKVEVIDENDYILTGKCIVENKSHTRCEVTADTKRRGLPKRVLSSDYSPEENRWSISLDVHRHYHVYYMDGLIHQPKMLCMPIHKEKGSEEEHYLHTLNDIAKHIEELYKIDEYLYDVHPFKTKKGSRKWSHIGKQERDKTMKDLEEYEVVFYLIEKGMEAAGFTFAKFWPLHPLDEDSICIPLFLTPLVQNAINLGPFSMEEKHEVLHSLEFENKVPSVYKYEEKYKKNIFSDMHNYYSNLYILPDGEKKESLDCYIMDCKTARQADGTVKAVWYAKIPSSMDEYSHCVLDKSFTKEENAEKFSDFIAALESREYNKDSNLQGFWVGGKGYKPESELFVKKQRIFSWTIYCQNKDKAIKESLHKVYLDVHTARKKLENAEERQTSLGRKEKTDSKKVQLEKNAACVAKLSARKGLEKALQKLYRKLSKKPSIQSELIVFRNVNKSRSNLTFHNEILDLFIHRYNRKKGNSSE